MRLTQVIVKPLQTCLKKAQLQINLSSNDLNSPKQDLIILQIFLLSANAVTCRIVFPVVCQ